MQSTENQMHHSTGYTWSLASTGEKCAAPKAAPAVPAPDGVAQKADSAVPTQDGVVAKGGRVGVAKTGEEKTLLSKSFKKAKDMVGVFTVVSTQARATNMQVVTGNPTWSWVSDQDREALKESVAETEQWHDAFVAEIAKSKSAQSVMQKFKYNEAEFVSQLVTCTTKLVAPSKKWQCLFKRLDRIYEANNHKSDSDDEEKKKKAKVKGNGKGQGAKNAVAA